MPAAPECNQNASVLIYVLPMYFGHALIGLAQQSTGAHALADMAARVAAGNLTLAGVIRDRQDASDEWQRLDARLMRALGEGGDGAEIAKLRRQIDEAANRLKALSARIETEFPQYNDLANPHPLLMSTAQAFLAPDEALLLYLTSQEYSWLWVLRSDTISLFRLSIGASELDREVRALRMTLDPKDNPHFRAFPAVRSHQLYQKVLAPAETALSGVHHLLIIPDGALQSLPLSVLVTKPSESDPKRLEDHQAIAWLARDYATSIVPSVSSLQALRQLTKSQQAPSRFFGIGDPVLSGTISFRIANFWSHLFRGAMVDVDDVRALPPLPETADELRTIAKTMGATDNDLLLGEKASEPIIRSTALDRYQIIEFATHALLSHDIKGLGEPALVLTPRRRPPKTTVC
jgi:CHAT domain-containing protein